MVCVKILKKHKIFHVRDLVLIILSYCQYLDLEKIYQDFKIEKPIMPTLKSILDLENFIYHSNVERLFIPNNYFLDYDTIYFIIHNFFKASRTIFISKQCVCGKYIDLHFRLSLKGLFNMRYNEMKYINDDYENKIGRKFLCDCKVYKGCGSYYTEVKYTNSDSVICKLLKEGYIQSSR